MASEREKVLVKLISTPNLLHQASDNLNVNMRRIQEEKNQILEGTKNKILKK
jgi:hypothetical protein